MAAIGACSGLTLDDQCELGGLGHAQGLRGVCQGLGKGVGVSARSLEAPRIGWDCSCGGWRTLFGGRGGRCSVCSWLPREG